MNRIALDGRRLRPAALQPPLSKSDALRALALADALGLDAPSLGDRPPADVVAFVRGLAALRARSADPIACGDGAAPFRILLGQAATRPHVTRFTGSARLAERPHQPLVQALRDSLGPSGLGITLGAPWPWAVHGTAAAGQRRFRVAGAESSQFATSLLLAAAARAFADGELWTVVLEGPLVSAGYLELTLEWLKRAGFQVQQQGPTITLRRGAAVAGLGPLPADWSSAGYLLAIAWRTGGEVPGLDWETPHPDRAMLRILREAGLTVERTATGATTVRGAARSGVQGSALECPDLIPTLAVLACALPGPSTLRDLEILRGKESDRLAATVELLTALGARAELRAGTLIVIPPTQAPAHVSAVSHGDHRLVLAAATAALILGIQAEIEGPEHVDKSFPGFFEELSRSGALVC